MKKKVIGVFVGSLREGSFNKSVARYLASIAPDRFEIKTIDIGDLPFYNEDLDQGNPPASWTRFRDAVRNLDAFLFFTPEYNRSVPAVLKNALDVGSRPYGQSVWNDKPGGIVSVSMGGIGGFGANHHLRQMMTFLNVPVMQQPEAYIGDVIPALDDKGNLVDASLQSFLKQYMDAYAAWVDRLSPAT
jgi:chromate reductase